MTQHLAPVGANRPDRHASDDEIEWLAGALEGQATSAEVGGYDHAAQYFRQAAALILALHRRAKAAEKERDATAERSHSHFVRKAKADARKQYERAVAAEGRLQEAEKALREIAGQRVGVLGQSLQAGHTAIRLARAFLSTSSQESLPAPSTPPSGEGGG